MKNLSLVVPATEAGRRLDVFLVPHLSSHSRAAIQKLIEMGAALLNGKSVKPSHKVHPGDRVEVKVTGQREEAKSLEPWDFPLEIVYEDEAIVAINKPSGVVTHPGVGNRGRTLANAVLALRPEMQSVGHPLRPGIVHRLDKETSGLLLLAKTPTSYQVLSLMFKERKIEKHYRALAFGAFEHKQGRIDKSLGRDPRDRKKISVRARKTRNAVTLYRVLHQYDFAALLDVQLLTGRTHQIRVHLSYEGHPIVGDITYGGGNWNRIPILELRADLKQARFFGLHAFSLDFRHPVTGTPLHLEAPLPSLWHKILPP